MVSDDRQNVLAGLAVLVGAGILCVFSAALMGSNSVEVARALAPIVTALTAGGFALASAWIAWKGIEQKIRQERDASRENFCLAVTAELIAFSTIVVRATSEWNGRARATPNQVPREWPTLNQPRVYEALIDRVGLVDGWAASAVIGFYGNVLDLNELSTEAMNDRPTHGANYATIAERFQAMACHLADALDGLNADRRFPIARQDLPGLITPNGVTVANSTPTPTHLQDLLRVLGGRPPRVTTSTAT